ncbi:hypothetical protein R3X28_09325 [Maribacter sp. TH_r10]|uniref:hypothetical protein n=1 Tax=Maribacter sp. TH_r10 TaxID=3082086 RepID=UPI002953C669|nr:hypothetical protein [Maribacter sp. TH_r10]MDV7139076.1 hypothetical protein [Maribacter sp. TH_r10]
MGNSIIRYIKRGISINQAFLKIIRFVLFLTMITVNGQSLQHPVIYTTMHERGLVLEKIEKYDWAKSIVDQLHEHVDSILLIHLANPSAILNEIPALATNDHENKEREAGPLATAHNKVLSLAANAGALYYLTEDEKYAQFAADILWAYIDVLAPKTPKTTTICGYAFFDPRTTYAPFAVAYDFIYDYLKQKNVKVFSRTKGHQVAFDNSKAQKAIANMVGNVLQEYGKPDVHGKTISNHPILTAPGALFGILCIEDDTERERLFQVFWEKGTAHQNSFKHTILPMFSGQGIWPESLSYSFMPIITMVLNIVDRIKPDMEVTADYQHIFEGNFLFDYLRHPNRTFVRYGDSKRYNDGTGNLYRYTLNLATRKGYKKLQRKAELALKNSYEANGGYHPNIATDNIFNNYKPLQLFWGQPIPKTIEGSVDLNKATVIVDHAGIAVQRNYVEENNEAYGLCGIIGGAHYVHSHLTGISMELYGAGYIMSANAGLPPTVRERKIPLHEHYFRLYAGNNTVVVNGTSHGRDEGSWKGGANVWQNKTVNIAAEPKHLEERISKEFNFATQFLDDTVNNVKQERTLSIIRTSATTGYYFDMFRSKSNDENKFHDYVYHNIGDKTQISGFNDRKLSLKKTDRYQNDIGDVVKSPGWRYYENTKSTKATKKGMKIRFDIEYDDRYMNLFIPEGVSRKYTKALAPPTREAKNGYINKKTQVLAIRQKGEAWDRPYIGIFEPSTKKNTSVQKVDPLWDQDKVIGAVVTSKVEDSLITDIIIVQDRDNAIYKNDKLNLYFKGRFGIVRKTVVKNTSKVTLYIGQGELLKFNTQELRSNQEQKGILRNL